MRRSLLILCAIVLIGLVVASSGFLAARHWYSQRMDASRDDLAWIQAEFQLSDSQLQHIRLLHEGYLPQCRDFCARIADKKLEIEQLIQAGKMPNSELDNKLQEIASLRAQCQANMLRHFQEVSATMPKEQGQRYLAEMKRLTLGSHEQYEKSMSHTSTHGHH